ncbi:MAG TPA: universal stress protein [Malonomonas sp.]
MRNRKILVPLDGSPSSAQTVINLIALKDKISFPMTLLHVLDLNMLSYRGFGELTFAEIEKRAREKARQFIEEQKQFFAASGLAVEALVKEGHICETICRVADSGEYGLLVIGRMPVEEKKRNPFGMVANEIIHRVKCPVLVV